MFNITQQRSYRLNYILYLNYIESQFGFSIIHMCLSNVRARKNGRDFISELLLGSLLFWYKRHHHVIISCSIRLVGIRWSPRAIAPRCHRLVALQVHVKKGHRYRVNSQMSLGRYLVKYCGKPGLFVSPPCGVPLVVTLCIVPLPLLSTVDVGKSSTFSTADAFRPLDRKICLQRKIECVPFPIRYRGKNIGAMPHLSYPHKELVILQTPSPILVAHAIYLIVMFA